MIVIQLVVFLAGIYIVAKGKINFSKTRELVKPNSTIIGLVLIVVAALPYFVSAVNDVFIEITLAVLVIIVSYFLGRKVTAI